MKTVSENRKPVEVDMKEIGSRLRAMRKHYGTDAKPGGRPGWNDCKAHI